MTRQV